MSDEANKPGVRTPAEERATALEEAQRRAEEVAALDAIVAQHRAEEAQRQLEERAALDRIRQEGNTGPPPGWDMNGPIIKRDARGRWVKGQSGFPSGPLVKDERSYTMRQLERDFIAAVERERTFQRPDGTTFRSSVADAILEKMLQQGMKKGGVDARYLDKKRERYIERLERKKGQLIRDLNVMENKMHELHRDGQRFMRNTNTRHINKVRRKTREI